MLTEKKENCCGCSACEQVCPVGAIKLSEDEEGFLYPVMDEKHCIKCGLCEKICAFRKGLYRDNEFTEPDAYAVKHRDLKIRLNSRSGGCFTALSDYILEQCGVVYGCGYSFDFQAIHKRATTKEERDEFCGSKYVQSNLHHIFKQVKEDLERKKPVMFSGTSCQVAALKKYLEDTNQAALYCVDIVCHGVPSPLVWKDYLIFMSHRFHGKVTAVNFRNKKKFGWKKHVETITIGGKEHHSKIFSTLFYSHFILRPSCYVCPYKSLVHPGDITLADFWGVSKAVQNFDDNQGVSLVLVNNRKGKALFNQVKNQLIFRSCKADEKSQRPLRKPFPIPEGREDFWKTYYRKGFFAIVTKYGKFSWKQYNKEQVEYYKMKIKGIKLELKKLI